MGKELANLSATDYQALIKEGKEVASKIASGEIAVQRDLSYLRSIKSELLDCVKAGLSYSDIARALKKVNPLFDFKPRQIKTVCEERKKRNTSETSSSKQEINDSKKNKTSTTTSNNNSQDLSKKDPEDVIPRTVTNISEAVEI